MRGLLLPSVLPLSLVLASMAAPAYARQESDGGPRAAMERARSLVAAGELEEALAIYQRLSELPEPRESVFVLRGTLLLRLGRIEESLGSFERALELDPSALPYLWQRGIALYYQGRYRECTEQFEAHRSVNPNDVENAAWHFLCVAATEGVAAARESLLPVGRDPRVPMQEIYELYAGRATAEDVLERARVGPEEIQSDHLFYAHLYLGLLAEASGDRGLALEHYRQASSKDFPFVMGDIARVALARLEERGPQQRD